MSKILETKETQKSIIDNLMSHVNECIESSDRLAIDKLEHINDKLWELRRLIDGDEDESDEKENIIKKKEDISTRENRINNGKGTLSVIIDLHRKS